MAPARVDGVSALRSLPLFHDAQPERLQRLASAARTLTLARGDLLFRAGEPAEGLYTLVKGQIKVFARADNGQEKVIEVVAAPACVGESLLCAESLGCADPVAHVSHAAALTEAWVLVVPREALMLEVAADPQLAVRMLADVSGRFNSLVRDIEAVTLHTAAQRVVSYLLRARTSPAPSCTVSLPASKGTIASLLSVTPEHFSRILHDLQSRGLISVQRREILIPDVQRLAGCV